MLRRNEPDPTPIGANLPCVAVYLSMAGAAQQDAIGEIGRPGVAFPPADVVGVDKGEVLPAGGAAPIALGEGEALRTREQARAATEVEREAVATEDCRDELGLGGH